MGIMGLKLIPIHRFSLCFDGRNKFYKETDVGEILGCLRKETVCFTSNVRTAVGVYLFLAREMKTRLGTEEAAISYVLIVVKY